MSDATRMTEGGLLETLLGQLTPQQAFMIGEIMGIMRKGDAECIARLEAELKWLRKELEVR